jgi:hypothetical protein
MNLNETTVVYWILENASERDCSKSGRPLYINNVEN